MKDSHAMGKMSYRRFAIMLGLHFIAMYVLMYAMVHDLAANVYNSWNQVYMAGLMTASMVAIELVIMGSMYPNKRWNLALVAVSLAALLGLWMMIRQQTAIGNEQFIRAMVPHHSGAILMCRQAKLSDRELQELCRSIIQSQQSEIDQMKAILQRLPE